MAGACSGSTGAIGSINAAGGVGCNSTLPREFHTSTPYASIFTIMGAPISSLELSRGSSYFVSADVSIEISGATQAAAVEVDCTLEDSPSIQDTQKAIVDVAPGEDSIGIQAATTIPLSLPIPNSPSGAMVVIFCGIPTEVPPANATITAATTIDAIQTQSNTSTS